MIASAQTDVAARTTWRTGPRQPRRHAVTHAAQETTATQSVSDDLVKRLSSTSMLTGWRRLTLISKSARSAARVHRLWYAWHGVCFMGCKSPVREWRSCGLMVHPLDSRNQVRDEGNCGEVTNRGEEACECARKYRPVCRRRSHSRQSCEATNRNRIQGRCGQVSEPIITKPSLFIRIGKSGACAAKVTRLIQGDPSFVSVRRACSNAERFVVNTYRDRRKSAEVVLLLRHTPLAAGRTER